jgi:ubiquinone/menaquinone biosynthesis C-methylase UbiE
MSYHKQKIVEQFIRWAVHSEADGMTRTLAAAGIHPDMKVLDVACGPGIVACAAALQAAHVTT